MSLKFLCFLLFLTTSFLRPFTFAGEPSSGSGTGNCGDVLLKKYPVNFRIQNPRRPVPESSNPTGDHLTVPVLSVNHDQILDKVLYLLGMGDSNQLQKILKPLALKVRTSFEQIVSLAIEINQIQAAENSNDSMAKFRREYLEYQFVHASIHLGKHYGLYVLILKILNSVSDNKGVPEFNLYFPPLLENAPLPPPSLATPSTASVLPTQSWPSSTSSFSSPPSPPSSTSSFSSPPSPPSSTPSPPASSSSAPFSSSQPQQSQSPINTPPFPTTTPSSSSNINNHSPVRFNYTSKSSVTAAKRTLDHFNLDAPHWYPSEDQLLELNRLNPYISLGLLNDKQNFFQRSVNWLIKASSVVAHTVIQANKAITFNSLVLIKVRKTLNFLAGLNQDHFTSVAYFYQILEVDKIARFRDSKTGNLVYSYSRELVQQQITLVAEFNARGFNDDFLIAFASIPFFRSTWAAMMKELQTQINENNATDINKNFYDRMKRAEVEASKSNQIPYLINHNYLYHYAFIIVQGIAIYYIQNHLWHFITAHQNDISSIWSYLTHYF